MDARKPFWAQDGRKLFRIFRPHGVKAVSWLGRLFKKKQIEQEARIVVLGASGAGKTTLIRYLETGKPVEEDARTTLGIDIRNKAITLDGWTISAIDVGGQELYRETLWALGVSQADAVIYVIDGTVKPDGEDTVAFDVSKFSFDYMLKIVDPSKPIIILINKQDLKELRPLSPKEAIELYDITSLIGRSFNVIGTSAKYGDGIENAMEWLMKKIAQMKKE